MFSILLENLQFKSFHGIYKEERVLGNLFIVNLKVNYLIQQKLDSIINTINYKKLFDIIDKRMAIQSELLEHIVKDIADEIFNQFSLANYVTITITKKNPPIENYIGDVSVSYELIR